jgi:hypothetical protein
VADEPSALDMSIHPNPELMKSPSKRDGNFLPLYYPQSVRSAVSV